MTNASIRPGQHATWQDALQRNLRSAVSKASHARIKIFTGTWQHDLQQANLLGEYANVVIKVYGVDSHRLALALGVHKKLAPLVRETVLQEMDIQSGNVRIANLV